ncbi:hypothetical protein NPIL_564481 [Nephila pilipes]|uniref:Uncharacterized protein n=1 Tax=Nephila pilipes TaxID=299642 RepID=A0A8X6U3X7_NEPPI|nr:hypothetical protein NPIL_564481 [Nephila pilipes]
MHSWGVEKGGGADRILRGKWSGWEFPRAAFAKSSLPKQKKEAETRLGRILSICFPLRPFLRERMNPFTYFPGAGFSVVLFLGWDCLGWNAVLQGWGTWGLKATCKLLRHEMKSFK